MTSVRERSEDFEYPHEMILVRDFFIDTVGEKSIKVGLETQELNFLVRRENFISSITILDRVNAKKCYQFSKGKFIRFLDFNRDYLLKFLNEKSENRASGSRPPYLGIVLRVYAEGVTPCLSLSRNREEDGETEPDFLVLKGSECHRLLDLVNPIVIYMRELEQTYVTRAKLVRDWFVEGVVEVIDPFNRGVSELPTTIPAISEVISWEYCIYKTGERLRRNIRMYLEDPVSYEVTRCLAVLGEISLKLRGHIVQCVANELIEIKDELRCAFSL